MVNKITKIEIIKLFVFDYSKRFYLAELEKILEKSHQTIKPYAEELVKEGILVRNEREEYLLNMKNKRVYEYIIIAEKEKLLEKLAKDVYLSGLFEKFSIFFRKSLFIFFGSAVAGIKKGSDIDVLVIGKENVSKTVKEFEEICNKKIHLIQRESLEELDLRFVKEIYKNHIIINNTDQVVYFFGELCEKNKLV